MTQCGVKLNEPKEILGLRRITKKRLKELCKKDGLYQTPALNDVLFLHYQGFQCIESLEEYTELKCLWLECNAISEIQGLDNQTKLKCLFLHSNLIQRIENLEACKELDTLNLSQNHIRKIENCNSDILPVLNTLNLSSNYLKGSEGLKDLENCKTLSVLDLSNNRIDDILVVKIFAKMPELKVLVLKGNPVVSKIPQYRKTLILECQKLTYLDSRPVFPKDRACAEAWKRGGYEEERKENARWNRKERNKITESVNATIRMRNKHLGPNDQLQLFPLSDSEDEGTPTAHKQHDIDLGVDMELDMWDEVANNLNASESPPSSDMNVSSSTSALSTTASNDQGSSDIIDENVEILNNINNEHKLLSTAIVNNEHNSKIFNEVITENTPSNFKNELGPKKEEEIKKIPNNPIFEVDNSKNDDLNLNISNVSTETDEEYKQEFNDTLQTICQISNTNNFGDENDINADEKKWIRIPIESSNFIEDIQDIQEDENYDPLKCMDDLMDSLTEQSNENFASELNVLPEKTKADYEYEKECIKVNNELQKDFEKLTTDVNLQMIEMYKKQDERRLMMDALLYKRVTNNDDDDSCISSSASSENIDEQQNNIKDKRIEEMVDQWDKETKCVKNRVIQYSKSMESIPEIGILDQEDNEDAIQQDNLGESESENPLTMFKENGFFKIAFHEEDVASYCEEGGEQSAINDEPNTDIENLKSTNENLDNNMVPYLNQGSPIKQEKELALISVEETKQEPYQSLPAFDSVEFEYTPLDISALQMRNNRSLNEIEKTSNNLKNLLQKLEDENEELYKDVTNNSAVKLDEKDNNELMADTCNIQIINDDVSVAEKIDQEALVICEEVIEDLIQSLKIYKPKNYEFGTIESDDEYHYGHPETQEDLPPHKTIRGFVNSFDTFMNEISTKKQAKLNLSRLNKNKRERNVVPTTNKEKSISLQTLLQQPNIKEFNKDTHESLDAELAKFENQKTKRIKEMVDRIYAQKDRYNDTLEVIDGSLKIVRQDTGAIEELNEPLKECYESDKETSISDYYTANSGSEDDCTFTDNKWSNKDNNTSNCHKIFKSICQNFENVQHKHTNISNVSDNDNINECNSDDDLSNDDYNNDEYEIKNSIYSNIDNEFFNKLDLNNIEINEQDENHIVQCTRSYGDLKKYIKMDKQDRFLTEEENNLVEDMINVQEKSYKAEQTISRHDIHIEKNRDDSENCCDSASTEDVLLEKMLQRTKELMEREERERKQYNSQNDNNENIDGGMLKQMMYNNLKESVKLYEYTFENGSHMKLDDKLKTTGLEAPEICGNNFYTYVYNGPEQEEEEEQDGDNYVTLVKTMNNENHEFEGNFDQEAVVINHNGTDRHNFIEEEKKDCGEFKELIDDVNDIMPESNNFEDNGEQFNGINLITNSNNNNNIKNIEANETNKNNGDNSDNGEKAIEYHFNMNSENGILESQDIYTPLNPQSLQSSTEFVECTMEVLDDNNDTIDTLIVNAEMSSYN